MDRELQRSLNTPSEGLRAVYAAMQEDERLLSAERYGQLRTLQVAMVVGVSAALALLFAAVRQAPRVA